MAPPQPGIKNVSAWRLNAEEKKEVQRRKEAGEDELAVTRELQQKKAEASRDRKLAAAAVANTSKSQAQTATTKAKAKAKAAAAPAGAGAGAVAAVSTSQDDATNKSYYDHVQADLSVILKHFGQDFQKAFPLAIASQKDSGVQDCFDKTKCAQALNAHGVYRASISIWWLNCLSSATPSIPMSRTRVEQLTDFLYGPGGEPKFHTDRMVEVAVSRTEVDCDAPTSLQIISPEELVHATLAGCARAILPLGFSFHSFLIL